MTQGVYSFAMEELDEDDSLALSMEGDDFIGVNLPGV